MQGFISSISLVLLSLAYAGLVAFGLATLPSPSDPVAGPVLVGMEMLILVMAPLIIRQMIAVKERAETRQKVWGIAAISFATSSC